MGCWIHSAVVDSNIGVHFEPCFCDYPPESTAELVCTSHLDIFLIRHTHVSHVNFCCSSIQKKIQYREFL